jgi:hypothetical protein
MKNLYLITFLYIISTFGFSQGNIQFIDDTYTQNKIREITEFLASNELEGRDTPSDGLNVAANYISTAFKKYGMQSFPDLEGYYQPVSMISSNQPDEIKVTVGDKVISSKGNVLHISGHWSMSIADWVVIDSVDQDLSKLDLKGKIVIFMVDIKGNLNPGQIMRESRSVKRMAQELQADGLIEVFKEDNRYWNRFYGYYGRQRISLDMENTGSSDIPHMLIRDVAGIFVPDLNTFTEEKISINMEGWNKEKFITYNVVGMVKGRDPELKNEFIVCSAHYDHVISNGVFHIIGNLDPVFFKVKSKIREEGVFGFTVEDKTQNEMDGYKLSDVDGVYEKKHVESGIMIFKHKHSYVLNLLERFGFALLKKMKFLAYLDEEEKISYYFTAYITKKINKL